MHSVIGREEQSPVDIYKVRRIRAGAPGIDVQDHGRSGGGPVALPQLGPVYPVTRHEEERVSHDRQFTGVRGVGARVNVLDHVRATGGSVAPEQLVASAWSVGLVEKRAIEVGQVLGVGARHTGVNVLDHNRSGGGPVALPEFKTMRPIEGREEELV